MSRARRVITLEEAQTIYSRQGPVAELKPCPMCGGPGKDVINLHGREGLNVIECQDCGTCGPIWNDPWSRADSWNQRTPDSARALDLPQRPEE